MPRRLPIYIAIDTSGSMHGEAIQSVNVGVQAMLTALRQDPHALDS
ncbi:MAG: tellurium resistance protein TerY, partial [Candidatus Electrothrix sp. GM3_4]|nr:tellurium resistance protein TerY [Candidatus Electrothrix sp. GM3_4]